MANEAWIVTLEIRPAENSPDPEDWFWTDVCPTHNDDVSVVSIEKVEVD